MTTIFLLYKMWCNKDRKEEEKYFWEDYLAALLVVDFTKIVL